MKISSQHGEINGGIGVAQRQKQNGVALGACQQRRLNNGGGVAEQQRRRRGA
jgi:hypothetical protein